MKTFCDGKIDSKHRVYMMAAVVIFLDQPLVVYRWLGRGLVAERFRLAWHAKPRYAA